MRAMTSTWHVQQMWDTHCINKDCKIFKRNSPLRGYCILSVYRNCIKTSNGWASASLIDTSNKGGPPEDRLLPEVCFWLPDSSPSSLPSCLILYKNNFNYLDKYTKWTSSHQDALNKKKCNTKWLYICHWKPEITRIRFILHDYVHARSKRKINLFLSISRL